MDTLVGTMDKVTCPDCHEAYDQHERDKAISSPATRS